MCMLLCAGPGPHLPCHTRSYTFIPLSHSRSLLSHSVPKDGKSLDFMNLESAGCITAVGFHEHCRLVETLSLRSAHLERLGVGVLVGSGHQKVERKPICHLELPPHVGLSLEEVRGLASCSLKEQDAIKAGARNDLANIHIYNIPGTRDQMQPGSHRPVLSELS